MLPLCHATSGWPPEVAVQVAFGGQPGWSKQPLLNPRSVCPRHTCAAFNGCRVAAASAAGGCGTGYISRFQGQFRKPQLLHCRPAAARRCRGSCCTSLKRTMGRCWRCASTAPAPTACPPAGCALLGHPVFTSQQHYLPSDSCQRNAVCQNVSARDHRPADLPHAVFHGSFTACAYTYLPCGSINICHPDDLEPAPYLARDLAMYAELRHSGRRTA